jgi:hypothetical protein
MIHAFPTLMRALKAAPLSRKAAPLAKPSSCTMLVLHHLDDNKRNLLPWNLAALCQRCHRQVQRTLDFYQANLTGAYPRWLRAHVKACNQTEPHRRPSPPGDSNNTCPYLHRATINHRLTISALVSSGNCPTSQPTRGLKTNPF